MVSAAIDIGNSQIKVGVFEDFILRRKVELSPRELIPFLKGNKVVKCIFCSVAKNDELIDEVKKEYPSTLIFSHSTPIPITLLYKTQATLGLDRIAAAVGAVSQHDGPLVIVDAGSCITCDLIDAKNNFLGGTISPGIKMRLKAMHTFTANLPLLEMDSNISLPGKSTQEAMLAGAIVGSRHEINGFIKYYQRDHQGLKLILCGGDAKYFDKMTEFNTFVLPNLVLEGLNAILRFNGEV